MRLLPLLLMIPVFTTGQDVQPIIAKEYLELIRKDLQQIIGLPADTGKEFTGGIFHFRENYYSGQPIKRIKLIKGTILLKYTSPNTILIGGNFTTQLEIKTINRLPVIQTEYAQGRSENGVLIWRGAETGELFSYGPALNSLEYDGSLYDYDINGRLVPKGNGNGKAANNYSYRIFRTAIHLNQSATISMKWKKGTQQVAQSSIKWGRSRENLVIPGNNNKADNFSTSLEIQTRPWLITGSYSNYTDRFSHSNRNGFFNRVYQSALLTPSSFDNSQGTQLGIGQRSYSDLADNPDFLLQNNSNGYVQKNRSASFSIEKRYRGFHYQVLQSVASLRQNSLESFQQGTAFFPLGFSNQRLKNETHYFLRANASYEFEPNHFDLRSEIVVNYIYSGHHSSIEYPAYRLYRHQRSASDFDFLYSGSWYKNQLDVGIKLNNRFHFSNTTTKTTLFLPGSSAWLRWGGNLKTKLSASISQFNSELPLNSSFAQTQFLKNSTLEVWSIYPTLEVMSYNGLDPIRSREWSARLELDYRNRFFLHGEAFRRKLRDDIFPVIKNSELLLKNLAAHQSHGFEVLLGMNSFSKNVSTSNSIGFFSLRNKVTRLEKGFNFTPVAGFNNVYKALVEGYATGIIVGSRFLRDDQNNKVIGADGFPVVDPTPGVIGDPTPDFVMKLNNHLQWKNFNFDLDWEWKKGGDAWNGTQGVLDYYGRSGVSALQRNTLDYIFEGTLSTGHPNTKAVDFYDSSLPVEKNRWTRYGHTGVAEEYIQKADYLKINNIGLSWQWNTSKPIQHILFTAHVHNILLWSPYKGADPNQLLFDQANTTGLDFFNLPSLKSFGFTVAIKF